MWPCMRSEDWGVPAGHLASNLTAYRVTFLVAASISLIGVAAALSIKDVDAGRTMVNPRLRKAGPPPTPTATPSPEPVA